MYHNNIYYEYDELQQIYVLRHSPTINKFEKGKIKPITKANFLTDFRIVEKQRTNCWKSFCEVYEKDYEIEYKDFNFLENQYLFYNNLANQYIYIFQPELLELKYFLEFENCFNLLQFQTAISYTKTWQIPGSIPSICVTLKKDYFFMMRRFDDNLREVRIQKIPPKIKQIKYD